MFQYDILKDDIKLVLYFSINIMEVEVTKNQFFPFQELNLIIERRIKEISQRIRLKVNTKVNYI